jgi:hypothetical protein
MTKNFNIARKPGQASISEVPASPVAPKQEKRLSTKRISSPKKGTKGPGFDVGMTTRKTIEVPEGYFYQVKLLALQRKMKEKELWAEILATYFSTIERL